MVWKDIPGFEGEYQVSDDGQVRSIERHISNGKPAGMILKGRILKPQKDRYGYLNVTFHRHKYNIHRLVALAFLEPIPGKELVNHIDGNKQNNNVNNLQYCDYYENNQHAYDIGLNKRGSKRHNSKLTEEMVRNIKERGKYTSYHKMAKEYGVDYATIYEIFTEKAWAYIPWGKNAIMPSENDRSVRLTEEQVIEIKSRGKYASYKQIAEDYGVGQTTIRDLFDEKTWVWIPWGEREGA